MRTRGCPIAPPSFSGYVELRVPWRCVSTNRTSHNDPSFPRDLRQQGQQARSAGWFTGQPVNGSASSPAPFQPATPLKSSEAMPARPSVTSPATSPASSPENTSANGSDSFHDVFPIVCRQDRRHGSDRQIARRKKSSGPTRTSPACSSDGLQLSSSRSQRRLGVRPRHRRRVSLSGSRRPADAPT